MNELKGFAVGFHLRGVALLEFLCSGDLVGFEIDDFDKSGFAGWGLMEVEAVDGSGEPFAVEYGFDFLFAVELDGTIVAREQAANFRDGEGFF